MIRKTLLMTGLISVFSLGAGAVLAQDDTDPTTGTTTGTGMGAGSGFDTIDTNGDGSLSEDEVRAAGSEGDFDSMDQNGDGSVSRDEYDSYQSGGAQ